MTDAVHIVHQKIPESITLTIDDNVVQARQGDTVLEAAQEAGIYIPTLCYDPEMKPYGACRLCLVGIEGMRGLTTACTTPATEGMVVHTDTPKVKKTRQTTMELIIINHHGNCLSCLKNQDCALQKVAKYLGIDFDRYERMRKPTNLLPIDTKHPGFDRDPNKCILCGKCVRACNEIAGIGAIDLAFRGNDTKVSTFYDKPLVESVCESCGECLSRCPTGALVAKEAQQATREIKTLCPYCGVGCSIYLGARGNKIVSVQGDTASPVNKGGLCVKGRFGQDFTNHLDRLTTPLIRKEGIKRIVDSDTDFPEVFREASWDEVFSLVAKRFSQIKQKTGPDSIGILSSAKFTNEENYVAQKFARSVIGTNNVDHCARLCHASTVAAALAAFGDGAMSNSISDFALADVLFVIGSNTTECHPIIGRTIRQGVKFGDTKLVVADPRIIELSELANVHLKHKPGTDVALLNAMMYVIIREGLEDRRFVEERTEGFENLKETINNYSPETVEEITAVSAHYIINAARLFAKADRAAILYGMGITQHTTGTDNVKSIANLLMLTGNMGREGTGFSPLRGQNNVQGACDMGALPNVLPGYQKVESKEVRGKFEKVWNCTLSNKPGLPVTEMVNAAFNEQIKAMYVIGENPMMSEPSLGHTQQALNKLEFLVVQDIFPTETAVLADVVLPAALFAEKDGTFTNTERRVQKFQKVVDPPGEARADWQIISALAEKMGRSFSYKNTNEIMEEIASLTPIYGGIHHNRLDDYGLQWPCPENTHPGTPILHRNKFTRGLGKFHAVEYKPAAESVSLKYPLLLTTGRILEHWHTGSMSRRSGVLNKLHPNGAVDLHPQDAGKLGIVEGDVISISSRRGKIKTPAHITEKTAPGLAFMAFHWRESPANVLTNSALDPIAKIPEFKVSAVNAVLTVLERAAQDNAFFAQLMNNSSKALEEYGLTPEEKASITSGDMQKIESWLGKLDDRLKRWLIARLQQEQW
jgi:formate dehydrogenase alpha subunit